MVIVHHRVYATEHELHFKLKEKGILSDSVLKSNESVDSTSSIEQLSEFSSGSTHVDTKLLTPDTEIERVDQGLENSSDSGSEKVHFVERLVDTAMTIILGIWPRADDKTIHHRPNHGKHSLSLRVFIQEILRRSKTGFSTLQVALYYLVMMKSAVAAAVIGPEGPGIRCGRRTFMASLMIAAKYLQDRNYSVSAWSKMSGLSVDELRRNELLVLNAMGWNVHIQSSTYCRWSSLLFLCAAEDVACLEKSPNSEFLTTLSKKRKMETTDEDVESRKAVVV